MHRPLQVKTLIVLATALLGCGEQPVESPQRYRSCDTTFRYVGSADEVFLAGSWNGYSDTTHELELGDDGAWTVDVSLDEGFYGYKFIADGEWVLDPVNDYRFWDSGVENSGVRVPDCRDPLLEFAGEDGRRSGSDRGDLGLQVRYTEGAGGGGPADFDVTLSQDGWPVELADDAWSFNEETWEGTLRLDGLTDGKYAVRVVATNVEGRSADDLLMPLWIEERPFSWDGALVYMIMTDRYANGDPSNDAAPTVGVAPSADYQGGDLQGVAQAIRAGELDELGVAAIWLTPWNTNATGSYEATDPGHMVTSYHGYWPVEPRSVEPRWGGEAALHEVVAAAHEHGIRVLMDLVVNHVHEDHPYVQEHPEWFHTVESGCVCGTVGCDWTARRLDCLFTPYLPDVDWTNNEAAEQFLSDSLWWLEEFDLDGFRVDAVKHVPDSAVFNLAMRTRERFETAGAHYFLMGETAMGWSDCDATDPQCNAENYDTISRYIGPNALDGQFDFVLFHSTALQVFAHDERGMIHADVWTQESQQRFPEGAIMTPYIGSHDTSRFISNVSHPGLVGNKWEDQGLPPQPDTDEPYQRLALAQTWNLTLPGAPLLYYGDEYGEYGGSDPDNRHFRRTATDLSAREQQLMDTVGAVGRARRDLRALREGELVTLRRTEDFWAYARLVDDEVVVVALNRSPDAATEVAYLPSDWPLAVGATLTDRVGGGTAVTEAEGVLTLDLPGWGVGVFAP